MNWTTVGQNCVRETLRVLDGFSAVKLFDNTSNPHTDADLAAHNALVSALERAGARCELVSEEYDRKISINGGGAAKVFVDPIDGTAFFIRGERSFSSVGLFVIDNGQPSYSFVGDAATGDIYHCDEKQAYKNGVPLAIPKRMPGKYILAGWAPYSPRIEKFFDLSSRLPKDEYLMLNFGQTLQSAKICTGGYDACLEILPAKLQEFAGAIIAWRAGGELSTMEGSPIVWEPDIRQTMLVSRSKELHQKLLKAFNS